MNSDKQGRAPAFSLRRCGLLVRNRLLDEAAGIGIGYAVVLGNNLLGLLLARRVWFNQSGASQLWGLVLVLGGLFLASQAFKGMHDGKAGSDWLLLPASPLEKYAAAAADYLLIYPLAAAALATLSSFLLSLVERALGGPGGTVWTPAAVGGLKGWAEYAIAAAFLMAGSASFRKAAIVKTAGVATLYVLALGLLAFLGALAFFYDPSNAAHSVIRMEGIVMNFGGKTLSEGAMRAEGILFGLARYGLAPLFALSYGYFRVFEKEARDEVQ